MGIFKAGEVDSPQTVYLVKRCPECFINLPIDAKRCYHCKTRVGRVDRNGKARKAVNWYSYLICAISWSAFIAYLNWAFF